MLLLEDWRLSMSEIAAESIAMSPETVGRPVISMSDFRRSDLSICTLTPCSLRSLRMSLWMSVTRKSISSLTFCVICWSRDWLTVWVKLRSSLWLMVSVWLEV